MSAASIARSALGALTLLACSYSSTTTTTSIGMGMGVGTLISAPATQQPDLTKPPSLGAMRPLTLPTPVTRDLANGLRLVVIEHHELPLADFLLIVRSGGERDVPGRVGLATLAADLLNEGTQNRSALEIADQEAFLGITLSTSAGWESSTIALHTPTAQLDSALALFSDVALRPRFADAELERLRKDRLTDLLQLQDRPPDIADRVLASVLYGSAHPYGRPLDGDEASTRAITRADVQRFYDTYYRPGNATLLVVGDVKPEDIERRIRALFGPWAGERGAVAAAVYPQPPAARKTTIYLVDKPDAEQSSFRIGSVGVSRATPEYFPLQVANTILGGAFTSRLNNNLRETKGYTYGAGSSFSMRRAAGPFAASAEIVAAKSDSALLEFMKELRAIRTPVPAPELSKAKRYLQNQLPGDFETTRDIAGQLRPLLVYGLPLDFYGTFVPKIADVSQADVVRAASAHIDPTRLAIVVVGDRKSIEAGLRATGIGDVVILTMDGQPAGK